MQLFIPSVAGFAGAYRSGLAWASGGAFPSNGGDSAAVDQLLDQIRAWEVYRGRKVLASCKLAPYFRGC